MTYNNVSCRPFSNTSVRGGLEFSLIRGPFGAHVDAHRTLSKAPATCVAGSLRADNRKPRGLTERPPNDSAPGV